MVNSSGVLEYSSILEKDETSKDGLPLVDLAKRWSLLRGISNNVRSSKVTALSSEVLAHRLHYALNHVSSSHQFLTELANLMWIGTP